MIVKDFSLCAACLVCKVTQNHKNLLYEIKYCGRPFKPDYVIQFIIHRNSIMHSTCTLHGNFCGYLIRFFIVAYHGSS